MSRATLRQGSLLLALLCLAGTAHAGMACLLFLLSCLMPSKKYGEQVEAKIIAIDSVRNDVYVRTYSNTYTQTHAQPLENTREFYVAFQVGMTRYVAWKKDTLIQMAGVLGGYNPKREQWIGKSIPMHFMDENWMGIKSPLVVFKTPEGKEWQLVVIDIIGPDGVDECAPYFGLEINMGHCKPQAEVDRPAREQEILAKMRAEGKPGPVWEYLDEQAAATMLKQRNNAPDRAPPAALTTARLHRAVMLTG